VTKAPALASAAVELEPGDRVMHRIFGRGVVLKSERTRDSSMVEVLFEDRGKKTLDLAFAQLQKL
jgi:DNA helicase-2/ATP-dependent DNA helicase PcrA